MDQRVVQISTFGVNVGEKITEWLANHPNYRLASTSTITVNRIGGPDINVLAVFEKVVESDAEMIAKEISNLASAIREAYRVLR